MRVVVTGMAGISPLGNDWATISANLANHHSAIQRLPELADMKDLNCNLAGLADFTIPEHFSRKAKRTMGRVSQMAVRATELALQDANLVGHDSLTNGAAGVAYGSSTGSTDAIREFMGMFENMTLDGINSTTYLRMMGHTAPVNIATYFRLKGRVITTSSACTSGSQGIGYAYEAIKYGHQQVMLAGGGEEFCPSEVAVFDTLFATSRKNDTPTRTPSPFDANRDGLVIGEGACTFVLESLDHARERGAKILAEIVGFGTNCDGTHVTQPQSSTMRRAMELALEQTEYPPGAIDYINAHGTATDLGDIAESHAVAELFGRAVPMSTIKGHMGHTLGACGALEAWFTIKMAQQGALAPTLNLKDPDPKCGEVDYIMESTRQKECQLVMSNNFAFGGINTSLIFKL